MVKIASIGDCCVDVYPKEKKFFLGGMAFNRAKWLAQNGADVSLVSAVGTDDWGKKYLEVCRKLKINIDYLAVLPGKTSHVEITLDQNQSPEFSEWNLGVLEKFKPTIPVNQSALIVTGLKPIRQLLKLPTIKFTAADFDGNTPYTFSEEEITKFASDFNLIVAGRPLKIDHRMILITEGERGSRLITPDKTYYSPVKNKVRGDTTGAGDVYISAFILNYLKTKNIQESMDRATQAAANIISLPRNLSV